MASKLFLFLGLLLALVLLISSEVAARDLAEASTENKVDHATEKKSNEVNQYGGYPGGGYPGGGRGGGGRGGGGRGGYGPGRGGGYGCRYGCCRGNYYGRGCSRCCSYAGEAVDAQPEAKPHN